MEIILSNNILNDDIKTSNSMKQIIHLELKLCMINEKNELTSNCLKLFGMNLINLLDTMIYIFPGDNNEQLLLNIIRNLRDKFKKLIINDSVFVSLKVKNINYINFLNQLLALPFPDKGDLKILIFENDKFLIRNPTNNESMIYFNEDITYKKQKKTKDNGNGPKTPKQTQNIINTPNTQIHTALSLENLD